MTLDEALTLINNLDMREAIRRYGSRWSAVFVGRLGEILGVHRHKEILSKSHNLHREDAQHYPRGTVSFIATPGAYPTREALEAKVKDCLEIYEMDEEVEANPNRRWFGKTLVIRHSVINECDRRLTTACTRPPTRRLSYTFRGSGRRVMPGVRCFVVLT